MRFLCIAVLCAALALPAGAAADAVSLDVPFVRQQRHGCGAAALAMVLGYWQGRETPPQRPDGDARAIFAALYDPAAKGIFASEMERHLSERGFRTFVFRGEWQDVEQHIARARPLIVALKPGPRAPLHYVVVAGFDSERGLVLLNDPARRKLVPVERAEFEHAWKEAAHWSLLALPPEGTR
jgi:predicted double-glycine peptidase